MCQAKPLPRCSSHAPGLVQAAEYKYQIAKTTSDGHKAKVAKMIDSARKSGISEEDIASAAHPSLHRLNVARIKMRQSIDEANERLRDLWEAELHHDATKVGFKTLTSNAVLVGREQRTSNALELKAWHKKLRALKGNDGKSIFARDGDEWMRNAVLEEEYTVAARKYKEESFQYTAVTGELRKMKDRFDELGIKANKTNDEFKEMDRLKRQAVVVREQQAKIHYAMILERAKKNLIDNCLEVDFKKKVDEVHV